MTKKITKLMLNGQEYEIREYQGGWWWWQPWTNTIAYYPFDSTNTVNDMKWSWTAYNLTNSWATFWINAWVDCMVCSNSKFVYWNIATIPQWATTRTFNFWVYNNSAIAPWSVEMYFLCGTQDTNQMVLFACWGDNPWDWISQYWSGSWELTSTTREQWFNACVVYDGTKFIYYKNWSYIGDWIYTINTNWTFFNIYARSWWDYWEKFYSNFIIEDKARTAQEVLAYYNATKDNYQSSTPEPEPEPQTEPCHICWGTGEVSCDMCGWTWQEMCPTCSWTWQIWDPEDPESRTECPDCNGGGFISCWNCGWTWMMTCSNCGWTWEEPGE